MTSFEEPLAAKKYVPTDSKQKWITSTVVNFVTETLQLLSVVEAPTFTVHSEMFHAVDPLYQIPPRKHISINLITDKTTQLQNKML
jgi:hypothetical protein